MRNAKNGKLDLPIYRAIRKYGFHNFTVDILESFIPDPNLSNEELIKQLDQLEIRYIEQYKAYEEGYNCTKGGDFGVLGLKMTTEQKKKVSENTKNQSLKEYSENECICIILLKNIIYMLGLSKMLLILLS